MAFGETAGGVEAAAVQAAEVEALDESSSDNVDLDPKEMKVRRKSRTLRKRKPKRKGMLDKKDWVLLSHLKKLPSALKQETDRLRGDKNDQVLPEIGMQSLGFLSNVMITGDSVSTRNGPLAAS